MNYDLPKKVDINGSTYEIRSDFRAALDICAALNDASLEDEERGGTILDIFYPAFDEMPLQDYKEAIQKCFWFIRGGEDERNTKHPQLVNWEQDFNLIVAPINRVVGTDVRNLEDFHWWSFLSAYMELGDCLFAQVVSIREKKARNRPLDKQDREFYRRNRDIIDIKKTLTEAEQNILKEWM